MTSISPENEKLIRENFEYGNLSLLSEQTGMSIDSLRAWTYRRGIKRKAKVVSKRKLPQEQLDLIRSEYPCGDLDILSQKLGKSKHAISELARKYGIKREIDITRNGSLLPLFGKDLVTFYWLGFIAADGYISKNGHLMVSQAEKDKDTIYKFAEFLGSSVYCYESKTNPFIENSTTYRVNVSDKKLGRKIREMFGLLPDQKKTYTSIKIDFIDTEDQAMAFLIGYLDGDGSLNGKTYRVECYQTWYDTFKELVSKLPKFMHDKISLSIKYKKSHDKDYCIMRTNTSGGDYLRDFVKKHSLPASDRKFSLLCRIVEIPSLSDHQANL